MAFGFFSGGFLFLCAITCAVCDTKISSQRDPSLPQGPIDVKCKAHALFISLDLPSSGIEPRFAAADATGVYPITESYGVQCGYSFSGHVLLGHVSLSASYFSCHTDNQNDEVFTFKFIVILTDDHGKESFYNVSKTCSVPPFSPREVSCKPNYMEVSVRTDHLCYTAGGVKGSSAGSSAMQAWQVILKQDGRQSEAMSTEDAAALGYYVMLTPGRVVFRVNSGQPHASVETVSGVLVGVIQATLFLRVNWMLVLVDLVAACSLYEGSFDGYRLHWRTPEVMTPLAQLTELRSKYVRMGVNGDLLDEKTLRDRGYSVTLNDHTFETSIPFAAEGGFRKSFVMDGTYNELYAVRLTYQQVFVDKRDVETKYNADRPMATPPIPRPPFSVNQTNPKEQFFTVYLGNIPFDVLLVFIELNGQDISVATAMEMGYSLVRVPQDNSTAYILKVPFDDQVVRRYFTGGLLEYSLYINWTLNILPQMEPYYHFTPVTTLIHAVPPVFDGMCADYGIRFMRSFHENDYLWYTAIGQHPLTQQLAFERGYVMMNDSTTFTLDVPLFTIGYIYENITLQQFYGTFELLTRNAETLEIAQSSRKSCMFHTTELMVCSTEGVMTVVVDITKSVPNADPARTTLLDPSCRPKEVDQTRVLFSFGLNTCGTRVQIDKMYVTYENEITFPELHSTDKKPVITRDARYRVTVRCIYPVSGTENLVLDRLFRPGTPGTGQMKPVSVPSKVFRSMQQQTLVKPKAVAMRAAQSVHGSRRDSPVDRRTWPLGPNGDF